MEERSANQRIANSIDTADDIHHYLSSGENIDRLFGILCSYMRRSSLISLPREVFRDTALDALQEVAVVALAKAQTYRGDASTIEAWVLRIAMNIVKQKQDAIRKHSKRESSIEALAAHSAYPNGQKDFLEYFIASSFEDPQRGVGIREQLQSALDNLLPEDQKILLYHKQYGFDYHEIAQRLGLSDVAVRVRSSRALSRLRAVWQQLEDGKRGVNNE